MHFWQSDRGLLRATAVTRGWNEHRISVSTQSGRRRGRQRKCWRDNIKGWTSLPMPELLTGASCRKVWKRISAESSLALALCFSVCLSHSLGDAEKLPPHLLLGVKQRRLGAGQDQLPCGSTETFSSNCQETESCTVRKCHTPRQPLQNHLSGVGDAVVGRRNAGWITSKSDHPCPCQNCSQGPPAEKTGRGSLLNRSSCTPDDPISRGTELN